jgi:hypothetical protein
VRYNAEVFDNGCCVERTTILVDGAQVFCASFYRDGNVPLWEGRFVSVAARRAAIRESLLRADPDFGRAYKTPGLSAADRRPRLPASLYEDVLRVWAGGCYSGGMASPLGETRDLNSFANRCGRQIHHRLSNEDAAVYVDPSGFVLVVVCWCDSIASEESADGMAWAFEILLSDCSDDVIRYVRNDLAIHPARSPASPARTPASTARFVAA